MSTEKIQLPDFLIADLYKSSLVDIDSFQQQQAAKPQNIIKPEAPLQPVIPETNHVAEIAVNDTINYLGENRKQITVIVNEPDAAYLHEDDLNFLINILKACQLTLADIAIVNVAEKNITYSTIKAQLNAFYILLFDVDPSEIRLPFIVPAFQVQKYDGSTIMLSPSLKKINQANQEGKLLKTKLWMSLKQVFGI